MGTWRSVEDACFCEDCTAKAPELSPDPARKRREAGMKNHLGTRNRQYVTRLLFQRAQWAEWARRNRS